MNASLVNLYVHKAMQSCCPVSGPTKTVKIDQATRLFWGSGKSKQKENGVLKLVVQAAKCIMEGGDWAQDYQISKVLMYQ